ncbi:MAG: hypothetical protein CBC83_08115 [Flavobacteriales bacterium TMED123]|nr:MAG: hypothetical protein CBC83_08115 [Flavobacteriales bacterium TMED123]
MPDPITRQSTFGEEVERGVTRSLEAKRLGIEQLLGDDSNQAILDSIQRERETAEGLGIPPSLDRITSIAKEDGPLRAVGEAVTDIPRAAGQQAGVLATMGAGARAASMLAPGMLKVPAGIIGGVAALTPDLAASSMQRKAQEQIARGEEVDVDVGDAYKTAGLQAALEAGGTALFLGKNLLRAITGIGRSSATNTARQADALRQAAQRSVAGTTARGLARGAPEIPIEIGQQILERDFAGLDLTSDEALAEYGEAAYLAGLVGGSFGVTGSFADRLVAGQAVAPTPQQEAAQVLEEVFNEPDAPEQTVAQATGQETTVGEKVAPEPTPETAPETTDTETTETIDTQTVETEAAPEATREDTRKAEEESRKAEEAQAAEEVVVKTEENVARQEFTPQEVTPEQRTAEQQYAADMAARRQAAGRGIAPEGRTETKGFFAPDYSGFDEPISLRDEEQVDVSDAAGEVVVSENEEVVVSENQNDNQADLNTEVLDKEFADGLQTQVDEEQANVDTPPVDTAPVDTSLDVSPLLTPQGLLDAGISKTGIDKFFKNRKTNRIANFVEGLESTNENLARQQEDLTAYAANGVSKKQSDAALAQAARIATEIDNRAKVPEDQIIGDEGQAVAIVDERGAEEEQDSDVVRGDQEISPTDESSNVEEEVVAADLVALQSELTTNPDGDVAAYFKDEIPSVGGFITNVTHATDFEQKARVETWIKENLSQTTRREYINAVKAMKKDLIKEGFLDGNEDFLLLEGVSKLAPPVAPNVLESLQDGNLTQALTNLRLSQGRGNRDVARIINALSKGIGTTQVELRSNVVDNFGRPAAGYFSPRTNTIVLNQDVAVSTHTLLHEVVHAVASAQLANPASPAARQMRALFDAVKDRLGTAYGAQDVDEFVSEALGNPEFRAELGRISRDTKGGNALQQFVNIIKNMIRALRGLPSRAINSVQSEVDALMDELIAPAPEFRNADDMFLASTPQQQQNILTRSMAAAAGKVTNTDVQEVGDYLNSANALRRQATLNILPLDSIARLAEREFPVLAAAIRELFSIINQKRGSRNEYLEKIRGTAREIKAAFKNDPEARKLFGQLATESTRLGYDPTRDLDTYIKYYYTYFDPTTNQKKSSIGYTTEAERNAALKKDQAKPELKDVRFLRRNPEEESEARKKYNYVKDMYNKLSGPQQQAYVTLRDAYSEVFEDLKATLLARLESIEADPALKKDFRNKLLYEVLYRQEISPYFPLSRKGNLWLTYQGIDPFSRGANGELQVGTFKETFTTDIDRNRRIRELRADPVFRQELAQISPALAASVDNDDFFATRDISEKETFERMGETAFGMALLAEVKGAGAEAISKVRRDALDAGKSEAEADAAANETSQGRAQLEKIVLEAVIRAAPERSLLRTFQPRAGTLGYETDAITTFEERMPIFTNQVNTLRYALPLEQVGNKINQAAIAESGVGSANRQQYAKQIADHVQKYITFAQNPNLSNWSKIGKSLTFLWTLGFNVASAIINLFILPTVVFAYLGGKYGYTKTMRYMIRNTGRYFNTGTSRDIKRFGGDPIESFAYQGPGLGNVNYSAGDVPQGLEDYSILQQVLIQEGYDNQTTIGDMLDTDTPVSTGINNIMGYVFNQTERLNRHVTAMTYYDLEMENQGGAANLTDDQKRDIARTAILEAEYTNSGASIDTAPTVSQSDVGSLAFMYKRFGVSMMFFQIRTLFDTVNYLYRAAFGKGPATTTLGGRELGTENIDGNLSEQERIALERKQALSQGAMLFASSALLAGAQGVPLIGTVRFIWNQTKDDDDEDFDSALKGWVGGEPVFYEGVLNATTGMDIAPRIAMNSLLYRTMPNQAEQSLMETAAEQLGGPALSLLTRMFGENGTLELWKDGAEQNDPNLFYRGLERAAPAAGGNIMRFSRYVSEGGAQNLRGDYILKDVTTGGLIGQLFGFAPASYTRQLEQNARDKAIDIAVSRERTNLLGRNNTRMRLGIPDNSLDADIDDFNMRHPEYPITTESKDRSYAASTRMDITMDLFDGVSISTPRQLQVLMERMYDAGDSF